MADQSKIEWTDASWNPIRAGHRKTRSVGWHCEKVSAGCANCYAEAMNRRLGTGREFTKRARKEVGSFLDTDALTQPFRWRRPRKIFVGSMTDVFGDWVSDDELEKVFCVMAACRRHTFQVLTKRPERMREVVAGKPWFSQRIRFGVGKRELCDYTCSDQVLPNVWLGVSVENQEAADARLPVLIDTPGAALFVSYEPALGPVDFQLHRFDVDWLIAGGESGSRARRPEADWFRSARDQCGEHLVHFFFKQWGEFDADGRRVGKKKAGRLLDGVEYSEFPYPFN